MIIKSFDPILSRLNSLLSGKMLVVIDYDRAIYDVALTKKEQNIFKFMITSNTIDIEEKKKDVITINNRLTFAICTNDERPYVLGNHNRREAIFECNDIYVGNRNHFSNIISSISTQDVGDAFYTYLRMIDIIHPPVDGINYLPNIRDMP